LFFLLTACSLVMAIDLVRGDGWRRRAGALVAIVTLAAALETIRTAGAALTLASIAAGFAAAWFVRHPRWILAAIVVVPIAAGAALNRPINQFRAYRFVQGAAKQHWGHVATQGRV